MSGARLGLDVHNVFNDSCPVLSCPVLSQLLPSYLREGLSRLRPFSSRGLTLFGVKFFEIARSLWFDVLGYLRRRPGRELGVVLTFDFLISVTVHCC